MKNPILVAFAFTFLSSNPATSQELSGQSDLGPELAKILAAYDVPGVGAAIVTSDGLIARGVAGVRQRNSEEAIRPDDLFHLGSCTKAMTATLLARSIEAQELEWNTPLTEALPDLAQEMDEGWSGVTLAHLLSHTAGMATSLRNYGELTSIYRTRDKPMPDVRREFVAGLLAHSPLASPGTKYAYANYGYVALGVVLERLKTQPWEQLIRRQVFEPLRMTTAGFGAPDGPYFTDSDAGQVEGKPQQPRGHFEDGRVATAFDNVPMLGPAGTVHCSLADWGKFIRLHLRGARGEEGLLLKPETFAVLHEAAPSTTHIRNWRKSGYGNGWVLTTRKWSEGKVIMQDGSNTAWFACAWIAPAEDFAVLVACNQGGKVGRKLTEAAAEMLALRTAEARSARDKEDK